MTEIPIWASILIALLLIGGSAVTLIGTYGVLRFSSFYARAHAPGLGATFGVATLALASILYFSITQTKPLIHEILLFIFMSITTPVTLMLLARAALYRDRAERKEGIPPMRYRSELKKSEDYR